ncbi:hypothetical protein LTR85_000037 [Meristemomyces frigidus]|nr:hypothetical protein LTR85_000037 [Meristemomyces frigidus]
MVSRLLFMMLFAVIVAGITTTSDVSSTTSSFTACPSVAVFEPGSATATVSSPTTRSYTARPEIADTVPLNKEVLLDGMIGDRRRAAAGGSREAGLLEHGEIEPSPGFAYYTSPLLGRARSRQIFLSLLLGELQGGTLQDASVSGANNGRKQAIAATEGGRHVKEAPGAHSWPDSANKLNPNDEGGENGMPPVYTEKKDDTELDEFLGLVRIHDILASDQRATARIQQILRMAQMEIAEHAMPKVQPEDQTHAAKQPPEMAQSFFGSLAQKFAAVVQPGIDYLGNRRPRPSATESGRASTTWTTTTATFAAKGGWRDVIEVGYHINKDGVRVDDVWRLHEDSYQKLPLLDSRFVRWWVGPRLVLARHPLNIEAIMDIKVMRFEDLPLSAQQYIREFSTQETFFVAGDLVYMVPSRMGCPHLRRLCEGAQSITPGMRP